MQDNNLFDSDEDITTSPEDVKQQQSSQTDEDFVNAYQSKVKNTDVEIEDDDTTYEIPTEDSGDEQTEKITTDLNYFLNPQETLPKPGVDEKLLKQTQQQLTQSLKQQEALNAELVDLKDSYARMQADFSNYRKRMERSKEEARSYLVGEVVTSLLPLMDNFGRAINSDSRDENEKSEDYRALLSGLALINSQFDSILKKLGVTRVATVGEKFNPHLHEAVSITPSSDYPPDTVIEELASGYTFNERLIRAAIVKVASAK